MITADHGCDPAYTATTDHTREYVPLVVLGQQGGNAQADVASAGNGDLDIFEITHIFDYFFLQNNFETDKSVCGEYKKNNLDKGKQLEQRWETDESVLGE